MKMPWISESELHQHIIQKYIFQNGSANGFTPYKLQEKAQCYEKRPKTCCSQRRETGDCTCVAFGLHEDYLPKYEYYIESK